MAPHQRIEGVHDDAAAVDPLARAAACEYRHFGDDSALLIVAIRAHSSAIPGEAFLELPSGDRAAALAVSFQPGAGIARIVFPVDRGVASAGRGLFVTIAPDLRVDLPEPVKRPAIGLPDGELDHAVAAALAGAELFALIDVLERRCSIAERVAADLREERTDATKLAQAYREIWEVRELFESREEAYRRSDELVDAAELRVREAEERAAEAIEAARRDADDRLGEAQARHVRELAAAEERLAEIEAEHEGRRVDAAHAAAELEAEIAGLRVEAERAAAAYEEQLETMQVAATRAAGAFGEQVEALRAESSRITAALDAEIATQSDIADRLQVELAEAVAGAAALQADRDEALAAAARLDADVEDALAVADEATAEAADATGRADKLERERDDATARADRLERERDHAAAQAEAIRHELAGASANVAAWSAELDEARTRAADAEALLEAEQTLHEARLAARVGSERHLADLFAEAQRERLRQTPVDEQRAQVEALEQTLERMKRRG